MKVLLLDGYNLMHRARYGFTKGPYNVVYNFFRGIRPLIEKFNPDVTYFALEGNPKYRYEIYPDYKANRKNNLTPEKLASYEDFKVQRDLICNLITKFPIHTIKHERYEGDDLIANLTWGRHSKDQCVVISNDTDFIQLYEQGNVSIYSPTKKEFLMPTEYNYVFWKALVGDTSDNIKGVSGVGNKTAKKILCNIDLWIDNNPQKAKIFKRNVSLITLADMSDDMNKVIHTKPDTNFEYVKSRFNEMEFNSMTKEKTWNKYVSTFDKLKESEYVY